MATVLAIYATYCVQAARVSGEVADYYGPILLLLGLPWSWPSVWLADHVGAGVAILTMFAGIVVNAAVLRWLGGWLARRVRRSAAT